jgi:8-oxo-dGTP diphosphatase
VSDHEVSAAGGLVTRRAGSGVEVALVHRPKYDDWTFPKGKVEPGETDEEAAIREVREETGLDCVLVDEFATVRYVDSKGRRKQVRYWTMTVAGGTEAIPNAEVDELRWLAPDDASTLLTYARDQALARRLSDAGSKRGTPE